MNFYYIFAAILIGSGTYLGYLGSQYEPTKSSNDIGVIKGRLILQDQADPSKATIYFLINGKKIKEIYPNTSGEFLTTLKKGQYSIHIFLNGYDPIERDNIISLEGTRNLGEITLYVSSKDVKVNFTDKSGKPYPNLELALMKGLPPTHSTFYKANEKGEMIINELDYATYNFSIGKETITESGFLWVIDKDNYVPSFELKALKETYHIILPRVVFSNLSNSNSRPHFIPSNIRYFAQAIKILEPITFSGIGIGLGLNGVGSPTLLELRNNKSNFPGETVIFEQKPYEYGATISIKIPDTPNESPNISSTGSFANSKKTNTLEKGIYWIVAKYESIPEKINILGGSSSPSSGLPLISSPNGQNWEEPKLPRDWKMLDVFLVE